MDQNTLKQLLHYNPETGLFVWLWHECAERRAGLVGKRAGGVNQQGYVKIRINDGQFSAHRLAFLYMLGRWPIGDVDHIDGERSNNAWANLREDVSVPQNQWNRGKTRHNKFGHKGVSLTGNGRTARGRPYTAHITVHGVTKCLGVFYTAEEAGDAYDAAARELHGEFYREPT